MNIQPTTPAVATTAPTPTTSASGRGGDAVSQAVASGQAQRAQSSANQSVLPQQSVKASAEVDRQALEDATRKVEKFVAPISSSLKFSIDEESGVRIVKVVDDATKEVIRQIPSEEMVAIARALESLQGLLVRQQA